MGQPIHDKNGKVVFRVLSEEEYNRLVYDLAYAELELQRHEDLKNGIVRNYDGTNGMTTQDAIRYLEDKARQETPQ